MRRRRLLVGLLAVTALLFAGLNSGSSGTVRAAVGDVKFFAHFASPGPLPRDGWTGQGEVVSNTGWGAPGSLKIVDDSTTAYEGARSPLVPIDPERHYDLTLYAHTDDLGAGGRILVLVEQFVKPAAGTPLGTRLAQRWLYPDVLRNWGKFTLNFTTAGRAQVVRISLFPAGYGVQHTRRAWFDEVKLTEVAAAKDPLLDAGGDPVAVSGVQNDARQFSPTDFWARVPAAAADPAVSARSLWSYELLRRHFFAVNMEVPRVVQQFHAGLGSPRATVHKAARYTCVPDAPAEPSTVEPTDPLVGPDDATGDPAEDDAEPALPDDADPQVGASCPKGQHPVVAAADQHVVASDLGSTRPIATPHPYPSGKYTTTFYPRRTQDYLDHDYKASLLAAVTMTGDAAMTKRSKELLTFLQQSQWLDNGDNVFARTYYPAEFARTPAWRGGWDFLFNWVWHDGYGYKWQLHEPDHHVNADIAKAMVRAFEQTGDRAYLDSATRFVRNQIPRYGWHSGIWNGKRYYWTEYSPSGTFPRLDATDNVQALVARAAAMVGYYTGDRRLLEYARGLLWYDVREWVSDGRWYYDGAENPMNQRKYLSHDNATLLPLLDAAAYLLRSGIPLDQELAVLSEAYTFYTNLADCEPAPPVAMCSGVDKIYNGQAAKLAPAWDAASGTWQVTTYLTTNRAGTGLVVADRLPVLSPALPVPAELELHVTRLAPPQQAGGSWTEDDHTYRVTPAALAAGVATGLDADTGDVFRISYRVAGSAGSWTSVPSARISFRHGTGTRSVDASVPTPQFPTTATSSSFTDLAARLAFGS